MEDDPFADLKVDSQSFLDVMDGRTSCPKCGKSRKYYCYTCYVPVVGIEHKIPKVKLPFKIDIIKHPSECDGKSTSGHARVIAPDDVTIYTYPCIPDYLDRDRVVLLFPGDGSINMAALAEKFSPPSYNNKKEDKSKVDSGSCVAQTDELYPYCKRSPSNGDQHTCTEVYNDILSSPDRESVVDHEHDQTSTESLCDSTSLANTDITCQKNENSASKKRKHLVDNKEVKRSKLMTENTKRLEVKPPFDKVIIIDSTWNQTKRISSDERLRGLTCLELKTRHSNFWRHQKDLPPTYLSTIEAIYYFVRDYHDIFLASEKYDGRYDNLLFFFTFMYNKIKNMYDGGKNLKAYRQRVEKSKSKV
ncbi:tRNA-uridine aminocarboxypropyltransferase 1-like [Ylistrum balloti]|uniref:tRNA-uridine aminocarboxypropyltransferase 1-like n=1 Tax=Ylistrum balloti TaxID=509963 RepID=UPI002905C6F4|nr:tRNA-uridine aminocarboxypropyltransferase 1-like [Ylistrum balloti]